MECTTANRSLWLNPDAFGESTLITEPSKEGQSEESFKARTLTSVALNASLRII